MSGPKSAKNKPPEDETATTKKCKDGPTEDSPNPAILMALQEQEERFTKKVKLAVRDFINCYLEVNNCSLGISQPRR